MLKAILFDFDGVIGDTYALNYEISQFFHKGLSEQDFKDHHNGNIFQQSKIHFKEGDLLTFSKKQKELFQKKHLFPLKNVLEILSDTYKLFIVSSTVDENIKYFLEFGGLNHLFTKILGATTHKSKEVKFQMILSKEKLQPEECIYITDTIGDIIEARKMNIKTVAVTWGFHDKTILEKENPYKIVDNEKELLEVIDQISNESKI